MMSTIFKCDYLISLAEENLEQIQKQIDDTKCDSLKDKYKDQIIKLLCFINFLKGSTPTTIVMGFDEFSDLFKYRYENQHSVE
jgi:hypothetical protein